MSDESITVGVVVAVTTALLAVVLAVVLALVAADAAPAAGLQRTGGAPSASCLEWSDGCVVCMRRPEGVACSTPGIACTRGVARCLMP
jgi:hypothetical protein